MFGVVAVVFILAPCGEFHSFRRGKFWDIGTPRELKTDENTVLIFVLKILKISDIFDFVFSCFLQFSF